jgi:hypothetical protein
MKKPSAITIAAGLFQSLPLFFSFLLNTALSSSSETSPSDQLKLQDIVPKPSPSLLPSLLPLP